MNYNIVVNQLIIFSEAAFHNGIFWTILDTCNICVGINAESGVVERIIPFDKETGLSYDRKAGMIYYKDYLYFIFESGTDIVKIGCYDKKIECIHALGGDKIQDSALFNTDLYLFLQKEKKILVLDMDSVTIIDEIELDQLEVIPGREWWALFWKVCLRNEKAYIACQSANCFLELDLRTREVEYIYPSATTQGVQDIYIDGSSIYVLEVSGRVRRMDMESGEETMICSPDIGEGMYSRIIFMNNRIWLLPAMGNSVCSVNSGGEKQPVFTFSEEALKAINSINLPTKTKTCAYSIQGRYIYIYPRVINTLVVIDTISGEGREVVLHFTNQGIHEMWANGIVWVSEKQDSDIYHGVLSLDDYIKLCSEVKSESLS